MWGLPLGTPVCVSWSSLNTPFKGHVLIWPEPAGLSLQEKA